MLTKFDALSLSSFLPVKRRQRIQFKPGQDEKYLKFLKRVLMKPFSDTNFSRDYAVILSHNVIGFIKYCGRSTTPSKADIIIKFVYFVHDYNEKVAEATSYYPWSPVFTSLLLHYMNFECKTLYKIEFYSTEYERKVQDRMLRLLLNIIGCYYINRRTPTRKVQIESCKIILKLCVTLRKEFELTNELLENITKKLFHKIVRSMQKQDPDNKKLNILSNASRELYKNAVKNEYTIEDLFEGNQTENGDVNLDNNQSESHTTQLLNNVVPKNSTIPESTKHSTYSLESSMQHWSLDITENTQNGLAPNTNGTTSTSFQSRSTLYQSGSHAGQSNLLNQTSFPRNQTNLLSQSISALNTRMHGWTNNRQTFTRLPNNEPSTVVLISDDEDDLPDIKKDLVDAEQIHDKAAVERIHTLAVHACGTSQKTEVLHFQSSFNTLETPPDKKSDNLLLIGCEIVNSQIIESVVVNEKVDNTLPVILPSEKGNSIPIKSVSPSNRENIVPSGEIARENNLDSQHISKVIESDEPSRQKSAHQIDLLPDNQRIDPNKPEEKIISTIKNDVAESSKQIQSEMVIPENGEPVSQNFGEQNNSLHSNAESDSILKNPHDEVINGKDVVDSLIQIQNVTTDDPSFPDNGKLISEKSGEKNHSIPSNQKANPNKTIQMPNEAIIEELEQEIHSKNRTQIQNVAPISKESKDQNKMLSNNQDLNKNTSIHVTNQPNIRKPEDEITDCSTQIQRGIDGSLCKINAKKRESISENSEYPKNLLTNNQKIKATVPEKSERISRTDSDMPEVSKQTKYVKKSDKVICPEKLDTVNENSSDTYNLLPINPKDNSNKSIHVTTETIPNKHNKDIMCTKTQKTQDSTVQIEKVVEDSLPTLVPPQEGHFIAEKSSHHVTLFTNNQTDNPNKSLHVSNESVELEDKSATGTIGDTNCSDKTMNDELLPKLVSSKECEAKLHKLPNEPDDSNKSIPQPVLKKQEQKISSKDDSGTESFKQKHQLVGETLHKLVSKNGEIITKKTPEKNNQPLETVTNKKGSSKDILKTTEESLHKPETTGNREVIHKKSRDQKDLITDNQQVDPETSVLSTTKPALRKTGNKLMSDETRHMRDFSGKTLKVVDESLANEKGESIPKKYQNNLLAHSQSVLRKPEDEIVADKNKDQIDLSKQTQAVGNDSLCKLGVSKKNAVTSEKPVEQNNLSDNQKVRPNTSDHRTNQKVTKRTVAESHKRSDTIRSPKHIEKVVSSQKSLPYIQEENPTKSTHSTFARKSEDETANNKKSKRSEVVNDDSTCVLDKSSEHNSLPSNKTEINKHVEKGESTLEMNASLHGNHKNKSSKFSHIPDEILPKNKEAILSKVYRVTVKKNQKNIPHTDDDTSHSLNLAEKDSRESEIKLLNKSDNVFENDDISSKKNSKKMNELQKREMSNIETEDKIVKSNAKEQQIGNISLKAASDVQIKHANKSDCVEKIQEDGKKHENELPKQKSEKKQCTNNFERSANESISEPAINHISALCEKNKKSEQSSEFINKMTKSVPTLDEGDTAAKNKHIAPKLDSQQMNCTTKDGMNTETSKLAKTGSQDQYKEKSNVPNVDNNKISEESCIKSGISSNLPKSNQKLEKLPSLSFSGLRDQIMNKLENMSSEPGFCKTIHSLKEQKFSKTEELPTKPKKHKNRRMSVCIEDSKGESQLETTSNSLAVDIRHLCEPRNISKCIPNKTAAELNSTKDKKIAKTLSNTNDSANDKTPNKKNENPARLSSLRSWRAAGLMDEKSGSLKIKIERSPLLAFAANKIKNLNKPEGILKECIPHNFVESVKVKEGKINTDLLESKELAVSSTAHNPISTEVSKPKCTKIPEMPAYPDQKSENVLPKSMAKVMAEESKNNTQSDLIKSCNTVNNTNQSDTPEFLIGNKTDSPQNIKKLTQSAVEHNKSKMDIAKGKDHIENDSVKSSEKCSKFSSKATSSDNKKSDQQILNKPEQVEILKTKRNHTLEKHQMQELNKSEPSVSTHTLGAVKNVTTDSLNNNKMRKSDKTLSKPKRVSIDQKIDNTNTAGRPWRLDINTENNHQESLEKSASKSLSDLQNRYTKKIKISVDEPPLKKPKSVESVKVYNNLKNSLAKSKQLDNNKGKYLENHKMETPNKSEPTLKDSSKKVEELNERVTSRSKEEATDYPKFNGSSNCFDHKSTGEVVLNIKNNLVQESEQNIDKLSKHVRKESVLSKSSQHSSPESSQNEEKPSSQKVRVQKINSTDKNKKTNKYPATQNDVDLAKRKEKSESNQKVTAKPLEKVTVHKSTSSEDVLKEKPEISTEESSNMTKKSNENETSTRNCNQHSKISKATCRNKAKEKLSLNSEKESDNSDTVLLHDHTSNKSIPPKCAEKIHFSKDCLQNTQQTVHQELHLEKIEFKKNSTDSLSKSIKKLKLLILSSEQNSKAEKLISGTGVDRQEMVSPKGTNTKSIKNNTPVVKHQGKEDIQTTTEHHKPNKAVRELSKTTEGKQIVETLAVNESVPQNNTQMKALNDKETRTKKMLDEAELKTNSSHAKDRNDSMSEHKEKTKTQSNVNAKDTSKKCKEVEKSLPKQNIKPNVKNQVEKHLSEKVKKSNGTLTEKQSNVEKAEAVKIPKNTFKKAEKISNSDHPKDHVPSLVQSPENIELLNSRDCLKNAAKTTIITTEKLEAQVANENRNIQPIKNDKETLNSIETVMNTQLVTASDTEIKNVSLEQTESIITSKNDSEIIKYSQKSEGSLLPRHPLILPRRNENLKDLSDTSFVDVVLNNKRRKVDVELISQTIIPQIETPFKVTSSKDSSTIEKPHQGPKSTFANKKSVNILNRNTKSALKMTRRFSTTEVTSYVEPKIPRTPNVPDCVNEKNNLENEVPDSNKPRRFSTPEINTVKISENPYTKASQKYFSAQSDTPTTEVFNNHNTVVQKSMDAAKNLGDQIKSSKKRKCDVLTRRNSVQAEDPMPKKSRPLPVPFIETPIFTTEDSGNIKPAMPLETAYIISDINCQNEVIIETTLHDFANIAVEHSEKSQGVNEDVKSKQDIELVVAGMVEMSKVNATNRRLSTETVFKPHDFLLDRSTTAVTPSNSTYVCHTYTNTNNDDISDSEGNKLIIVEEQILEEDSDDLDDVPLNRRLSSVRGRVKIRRSKKRLRNRNVKVKNSDKDTKEDLEDNEVGLSNSPSTSCQCSDVTTSDGNEDAVKMGVGSPSTVYTHKKLRRESFNQQPIKEYTSLETPTSVKTFLGNFSNCKNTIAPTTEKLRRNLQNEFRVYDFENNESNDVKCFVGKTEQKLASRSSRCRKSESDNELQDSNISSINSTNSSQCNENDLPKEIINSTSSESYLTPESTDKEVTPSEQKDVSPKISNDVNTHVLIDHSLGNKSSHTSSNSSETSLDPNTLVDHSSGDERSHLSPKLTASVDQTTSDNDCFGDQKSHTALNSEASVDQKVPGDHSLDDQSSHTSPISEASADQKTSPSYSLDDDSNLTSPNFEALSDEKTSANHSLAVPDSDTSPNSEVSADQKTNISLDDGSSQPSNSETIADLKNLTNHSLDEESSHISPNSEVTTDQKTSVTQFLDDKSIYTPLNSEMTADQKSSAINSLDDECSHTSLSSEATVDQKTLANHSLGDQDSLKTTISQSLDDKSIYTSANSEATADQKTLPNHSLGDQNRQKTSISQSLDDKSIYTSANSEATASNSLDGDQGSHTLPNSEDQKTSLNHSLDDESSQTSPDSTAHQKTSVNHSVDPRSHTSPNSEVSANQKNSVNHSSDDESCHTSPNSKASVDQKTPSNGIAEHCLKVTELPETNPSARKTACQKGRTHHIYLNVPKVDIATINYNKLKKCEENKSEDLSDNKETGKVYENKIELVDDLEPKQFQEKHSSPINNNVELLNAKNESETSGDLQIDAKIEENAVCQDNKESEKFEANKNEVPLSDTTPLVDCNSETHNVAQENKNTTELNLLSKQLNENLTNSEEIPPKNDLPIQSNNLECEIETTNVQEVPDTQTTIETLATEEVTDPNKKVVDFINNVPFGFRETSPVTDAQIQDLFGKHSSDNNSKKDDSKLESTFFNMPPLTLMTSEFLMENQIEKMETDAHTKVVSQALSSESYKSFDHCHKQNYVHPDFQGQPLNSENMHVFETNDLNERVFQNNRKRVLDQDLVEVMSKQPKIHESIMEASCLSDPGPLVRNMPDNVFDNNPNGLHAICVEEVPEMSNEITLTKDSQAAVDNAISNNVFFEELFNVNYESYDIAEFPVVVPSNSSNSPNNSIPVLNSKENRNAETSNGVTDHDYQGVTDRLFSVGPTELDLKDVLEFLNTSVQSDSSSYITSSDVVHNINMTSKLLKNQQSKLNSNNNLENTGTEDNVRSVISQHILLNQQKVTVDQPPVKNHQIVQNQQIHENQQTVENQQPEVNADSVLDQQPVLDERPPVNPTTNQQIVRDEPAIKTPNIQPSENNKIPLQKQVKVFVVPNYQAHVRPENTLSSESFPPARTYSRKMNPKRPRREHPNSSSSNDGNKPSGFADYGRTLRSNGPPEPPNGMPLVSAITEGAIIRWGRSGGKKAIGYVIEYTMLGSNIWASVVCANNSLSYVVRNLQAGGRYVFRVKAYNMYGCSEPGMESDVVQLPDIQSAYVSHHPIRPIITCPIEKTKHSDHHNESTQLNYSIDSILCKSSKPQSTKRIQQTNDSKNTAKGETDNNVLFDQLRDSGFKNPNLQTKITPDNKVKLEPVVDPGQNVKKQTNVASNHGHVRRPEDGKSRSPSIPIGVSISHSNHSEPKFPISTAEAEKYKWLDKVSEFFK